MKEKQKSSNIKSYYFHVPASLLKFAGLLFSLLAKIGIRSSFNEINAQILCAGNYYSNSKAVKNLALPLTPITVAVEDAISWFKQSGALKTS
jgi:dihydroflavonol-4-reductase